MDKNDHSKLVFIDESVVDTWMSRLYGRSLKGERVYGTKPIRVSEKRTIIAGLSKKGIVAPCLLDGNVDGEFFLSYVREILVPELKKGQIVIIDNLPAHKVEGIEEAIKQAGAGLIYMPPYSPDFSPMEECWSKIMAWLRKRAGRSLQQLQLFIKEAFDLVTEQDIKGWFAHCGYCI